MNFLKRFLDWDGNYTPFEKVISVLAYLLFFGGLLFGFISAIFQVDNGIGRAAAAASGAVRAVGFVLLIASIVWIYLVGSNRIKFKVSGVAATIILFAGLASSLLFLTGWFAVVY